MKIGLTKFKGEQFLRMSLSAETQAEEHQLAWLSAKAGEYQRPLGSYSTEDGETGLVLLVEGQDAP